MNILITGGAGFIGTNTALYFDKKNWKITILDNFYRPGVDKNAAYLSKQIPTLKIIHANINDTKKYIDELKNTDIIVHLAGQTAVTTSIENPQLDFESNLLGSFRLLETIRKHNPKAIVLYSSTNKVYGDLTNHIQKKNDHKKMYEDICHPEGITEDEQLDFISPYGCSKGAGDLYMQDYARNYGLQTVVFRQSCIYGPFQIGVEDQGWLAHFSKQMLHNKVLKIYGDGYQVRDLLYIDDLTRLYEKAIENIDTVKGQAINAGGGVNNSYSLLQVLDVLKKEIHYDKPLTFSESRLGDQKYFVSANKKAKKLLAWQPKVDLHDGVRKLIAWQKKNILE